MNLRRLLAGVVVVVLGATLVACSHFEVAPGGYQVKAVFPQAIGLYNGSPVKILGIDAGVVTKVKPVRDRVEVTMRIDKDTKLPADVTATILPVSVIGEMYVQLSPVYTSGAAFQPGHTISHTSVPVSLDELLRGADKLAGSISPKVAKRLVDQLAGLLDGQGQRINDLLRRGSAVVKLLASKSDDIGDIVDTSNQIVQSIQAQGSDIQTLITNYQRVTQVLADNNGAISDSITNFNQVGSELIDLLNQHIGPLRSDVGEITHVGRTLDRNLDTLSSTFASTATLFDNVVNAYDPRTQSLKAVLSPNLDNLANYSSYLLRDRFAGICRRLHVATCSDPRAPFYQQMIDMFSRLLNGLPIVGGSTNAPAATDSAAPSTGQTSEATPSTSSPSATPTTTPSGNALDAATKQVLAQIFGQLDAKRLAALKGVLNPALSRALAQLTPTQLVRLEHVSVAQLATLRDVAPDQAGTALDRVIASVTPAQLLEPLLPAAKTRSGSNLLQSVLQGLGGLS